MDRPLPALLVLLCCALVLSAGVGADADLWWHLSAGREVLAHGVPTVDTWSYTATGAPWIHHEWIYGALLAAVYDTFGNAGMVVFRALWLGVLTMALTLAVFRRTRSNLLTVLLVGTPLPFIALLANLRPQTVTWALVPVAVVVLDRVWEGQRGAVLQAVLLAWAWVNLHGGFLFGWGLLGLGLLSAATGVDGRHPRAWLGIVGLLCVPWLNAYGPALLVYVVEEITVGHPDLPEWNPPGRAMSILVGGVALVVLASQRVRSERTLQVAFLVATVATLRAAKMVELMLLMAPILTAPAAAAALARLGRAEGGAVMLTRLASGPALAVGALLIALPTARFARPPGVHVDPAVYPVEALSALRGPPRRLLVPLGWGGIAHYRLPDWPLAIDGRNTTVYEPEAVAAYTEALVSGDLDVLLRGSPEVALVRPGSGAAAALRDDGWHLHLTTPTAVVLARVPLDLAPAASVTRFPAVQPLETP